MPLDTVHLWVSCCCSGLRLQVAGWADLRVSTTCCQSCHEGTWYLRTHKLSASCRGIVCLAAAHLTFSLDLSLSSCSLLISRRDGLVCVFPGPCFDPWIENIQNAKQKGMSRDLNPQPLDSESDRCASYHFRVFLNYFVSRFCLWPIGGPVQRHTRWSLCH